MATVFQKPGSPYWYTAYFDGDGKRRYRSTKCKNRSKAITAGAEMERAARKTSSQDEESTRRIYSILEEASEKAIKGTLTESSARQLLSRILEASIGEPLNNPSVEEWLTEWLGEKEKSQAQGTFLRYEGVIRPFLKFLSPKKRESPLSTLSTKDIRKYRDSLMTEGRTPATANAAVKIIRAPLNSAKRQGILTHSPADAVAMVTVTSAPKSVFTLENVKSLLAATDGEWKGLILAGYYTGARIGDLSNLLWESVDLNLKIVSFTQGKTNRRVAIPLHPDLESWLAKQHGKKPSSTFVFPSLFGKTTGGRNGLSGKFRRIMQKAKIHGEITERTGEKGKIGRAHV